MTKISIDLFNNMNLQAKVDLLNTYILKDKFEILSVNDNDFVITESQKEWINKNYALSDLLKMPYSVLIDIVEDCSDGLDVIAQDLGLII